MGGIKKIIEWLNLKEGKKALCVSQQKSDAAAADLRHACEPDPQISHLQFGPADGKKTWPHERI